MAKVKPWLEAVAWRFTNKNCHENFCKIHTQKMCATYSLFFNKVINFIYVKKIR